jgi:hypothetical protein
MNVSLPETMEEFGRQKVAIVNNESASEGGRRRWLLPGTAQRNFALRSVTLSPTGTGVFGIQGVVSNRRSEPGLFVE